ncbi:MAG: UDP-N-acetylglucosamine 4,6-dehydratase (inverting) [Flavobacteriaceae bacterium]|nr:MAG: UDP-N-acetylglucosamine 4,6-dehydratase (inverting) [Flavobacteriaceae bacterium]
MILVTGATGMLGAHFLLSLSSQKKKIRAFYRTEEKRIEVVAFFKYHNKEKNLSYIEWLKGSYDQIDLLDQALEEVDTVIHCAALISFDPKRKSQLYKTNVEGTRNLVNALISKKINLIFISSIAAANEGASSYYGYTKYLSELEVYRGVQEGIKATIVRPGVILSDYFWNRPSGSIFKQLAQQKTRVTKGSVGLTTANTVVRCTLHLSKNEQKTPTILVTKIMRYDELAKAMGAEKIQFIGKPILRGLSVIEAFYAFIFRKPRKLSSEIVDSLTSESIYPTLSDYPELKEVELENFEAELKQLSQSYRATCAGA